MRLSIQEELYYDKSEMVHGIAIDLDGFKLVPSSNGQAAC